MGVGGGGVGEVRGRRREARGESSDLEQGEENIRRPQQLALVPVVYRAATAAVALLLGWMVGDIEPERAHLADSPGDVCDKEPGGASITEGEPELDERGQEGVRVDEKEKRALEVRRHVTKVNVLVLLVTAL